MAHELIRFYTERSFRPFAIEAGGLRPVEGPDLGAVPKRGYVDLILTRRAS